MLVLVQLFILITVIGIGQSILPHGCQFRNLTYAICSSFNHSAHKVAKPYLRTLIVKDNGSLLFMNASDMLQYPSLSDLQLDTNQSNINLPWYKFNRRAIISNVTVYSYDYRSHSLNRLYIRTSSSLCNQEHLWLFRSEELKKRTIDIPIGSLSVQNRRGPVHHLPFSPWKYLLLPKRIILEPNTNCSDESVTPELMRMQFMHKRITINSQGDTITISCEIQSTQEKDYGLIFDFHTMVNIEPQRARYQIDEHSYSKISLTIENVTVLDNMWITCDQTGPDFTKLPEVRALPLVIAGPPRFIQSFKKNIDQNYYWCNAEFKAFPIPDIQNITLSYELFRKKNYTKQNFIQFKPEIRIGRIGDQLFDFSFFTASIELRKSVGFEGLYTVTACNEHGCTNGTCSMQWDREPGMMPRFVSPFAQNKSNSAWLMLKITFLFCFTLLLIIFGSISFRLIQVKCKIIESRLRNRGTHQTGLELDPLNLERVLLENTNYNGSCISTNQSNLSQDPVPFVFPSNVILYEAHDLRMESTLGEGAFGTVYLVKYNSMTSPQKLKKHLVKRSISEYGDIFMAAKKLEVWTKEQMESFHREAGNLACLSHENIVSFFGICRTGTPQSVVLLFEYMIGGDLRTFLQDRAPRNIFGLRAEGKKRPPAANGTDPELPSPSTDSSAPLISNQVITNPTDYATPADLAKKLEPHHLDMLHLLNIAEQASSGLVYLAENKFVHRDLAARNCLVGEGLRVKISDFGMSRDLYCEAYYKSEGSKLVPVRWLPPESIAFGRFTSCSDVWSLGVVLWEIFSYGQQPWCGLSNKEVIDEVKRGIILEKPNLSPDSLYDIMVKCWYYDPEERPSAYQILQYLRELRENGEHTSH